MNQHTGERLEFPAVLEQMGRWAETRAGREHILALMPDPDEEWLREQQALYREALAAPTVVALTLSGAEDLTPYLDRAAKGGLLAPVDLIRVAVTIERGERVAEVLDESVPLLGRQFGRFHAPRGLRRGIAAAVTDGGEIRDTASPKLSEIRRRLRELQADIDQIFQRLLRSSTWAEYLQEPLVTVRNGRRVVPVKHVFRNKVPGLVHDQSGTGQTVFVEPMAVVERQNDISAKRGEEAEEIERILRQLTAEVAQSAEGLALMSRSLIGLDVLLAKVRWGQQHDAVLPVVGGDALDLREARHPLLARPVPMTLTLSPPHQVVVITGPNTGGKTVALKCTGLMVWLALSGCPIPADEGSRVPLYRQVLADIGDEQSLQQSLSTFSGHLKQLVPMVQDSGPGTLLLIDEIGAGTDPEEGAALAVALLEVLMSRGSSMVVTTHFSRVKLMAYNDGRVENAEVYFDRETLSPTYRLVMGQPGSSQALYIASRLGLDAEVVTRAEALMGSDEFRVEQVIAEVNQLESRLRNREAELVRTEQQLAEAHAALEQERIKLERQHRRQESQVGQEWRRALSDLRQEALGVIEAVKTAEKGDRARALEALRAEMRTWNDRVPTRGVGNGGQDGRVAAPGSGPEAIRPGTLVQGDLLAEPGLVVEIHDQTAVVEVGSMRMRVPVEDLQVTQPSRPPARARANTRPVRPADLRMECDLRGMTALEAVDALDKYLDDAILLGFPMVRVIHGKGTGALRRAVQEYLGTHPQVKGFRLGETGEGGDGVTVVRLDDESP